MFYSPLVGSDPRVSGPQLHPSRMAQGGYPPEQCGDGTLGQRTCAAAGRGGQAVGKRQGL